jgi:hypothetical protein
VESATEQLFENAGLPTILSSKNKKVSCYRFYFWMTSATGNGSVTEERTMQNEQE